MTLVMESPKLRELTRAQLQSLAKREVVRAVGKTEDIIRRLMRKHPRGVPVPEHADNPSASSAPPKRIVLKISLKRPPLVPKTSETGLDSKGGTEPAAKPASASPSSSSEVLEELLYPEDEPYIPGPSNTNPEASPDLLPEKLSPVPPPEHPSHEAHDEDEDARNAALSPNPDGQTNEEDEVDKYDYPKGAPTHYMVVDTLRQFTKLVNTIPPMEMRLAESRCLIKRTETLLEKTTPDARELAVTREYLETFLLGKMKKKRELWDGTGKMNKEDRKLRMEWLRAERKAENEKRWKEANESNMQHGLEPEPFSAFASESDEDVIESLETTPVSSRSGSRKRSREDSADAKSNGDAGAGDESHRKRARS